MALIVCPDCSTQLSDLAPACPKCGRPMRATAPVATTTKRPKNRTVAIVLALFLGGVGAHKFYLEKPGEGFLFILFCWTFIPAILGLFAAFHYMSLTDQQFQESAYQRKL
jgi:TM2 domain-containing membrane protein YozV